MTAHGINLSLLNLISLLPPILLGLNHPQYGLSELLIHLFTKNHYFGQYLEDYIIPYLQDINGGSDSKK